MEKLIITAAICGAEVTKQHNSAVPYTLTEIASQAYGAYKAGASIIHLHVRNDDGTPTQSAKRFELCVSAIKDICPDVIIQLSTGGAVGMSDDKRIQPLTLKPEMATLDCGTINFGQDEIFVNSENTIIRFAQQMYLSNIMPEIEVFDKGMIDHALQLYSQGHLKGHLHFNFVLGTACGIAATPRDLLYLSQSIPLDSTFTVSAVGRHQLPMTTMAILLGGNVRVGFEDNVYMSKGVPAKSNADFVERTVRIANELGRLIATPDEARKILKLGERK